MNNKNKEVIDSIAKVYKELYKHKEDFNPSYFKVTIKEVDEAVREMYGENEAMKVKKTVKKTKVPSEIILNIKTEEEVLRYYEENLRYKHSSSGDKEKCLKRISLEELKHLYRIIYKIDIKGKVNKGKVLEGIEKYFDSKSRVESLKL